METVLPSISSVANGSRVPHRGLRTRWSTESEADIQTMRVRSEKRTLPRSWTIFQSSLHLSLRPGCIPSFGFQRLCILIINFPFQLLPLQFLLRAIDNPKQLIDLEKLNSLFKKKDSDLIYFLFLHHLTRNFFLFITPAVPHDSLCVYHNLHCVPIIYINVMLP